MSEPLEPLSHKGDSPNWAMIAFLVVFHMGAIAALFFFTWKAIAVAFMMQLGGALPGHRHVVPPPAHPSFL